MNAWEITGASKLKTVLGAVPTASATVTTLNSLDDPIALDKQLTAVMDDHRAVLHTAPPRTAVLE
jgi:hypothetical protein